MAHIEFLQAFAKSQGLDNADQLLGTNSQKYGYAINSRETAQATVESIESRLPFKLEGLKVLHIGAGYGSIAIELAKRGASVVGVETADPKRTLAEINAQGEADVKFLKSYLSVRSHVELLKEHGPFSVIIVHELFRRTYDTVGLLNSLKSLLAPDGLLNCRITNFFTPQAVLSDPVQKKVGLTLLPPDKVFDYVGGTYGTYFRSKTYYDALFKHVGFSDGESLIVKADSSPDRTKKAIDVDLRRIRSALKQEDFQDPKMFIAVRAACREYIDEATADLRTLAWDELYEKYRAPNWDSVRSIELSSSLA
jgi:hypothetical protein